MGEAKFTPGPWVADEGGCRIYPEHASLKGQPAIHKPEIAVAFGFPDADLIVTSPKMYRTLERCREFALNAIWSNVDLPEFDPADHELIREIDTILAEARGES